MAAKAQVEIGAKVGNITGAMNQLTSRINRGLAPLRGMQNAGAKLKASLAPLAGVAMAAAAGFAAAAAGAAGVAFGVKKALDLGGELSDLSSQTGIAVDQLMILRRAFENNGMAADEVAPAVNRLQKAIVGIGGKEGQATIERLGLSLENLEKQNPSEQLESVGRAINALETPAERTAAAMAIFGRSGARMLTLFADAGAMGNAARQVGTQARIMAENAELFDRVSDGLGAMGQKLQGFFVGLASEIAPVIEPLIDWINGLDLAQVGVEAGRMIAMAIQAITDGSIWQILLDSALIAIRGAINFLWKGMGAVVAGVGQYLLSQFMMAVEALSVVTTAEFWVGVGNQLMAWISKFNAAFYGIFAGIVEKLQPLLAKVGLGGAATRMAAGLRSEAAAQSAAGDSAQGQASDLLNPIFDRLIARQSEEFGRVEDAFTDTFDAIPDLLDNSEMQDRLDGNIDRLASTVQSMGEEARAKDGKKKGAGLDDMEGGAGRGLRAERLNPVSGMGVFVKNILQRDPILDENRRQTALLQKQNGLLQKLVSPVTGAGGLVRRFGV
jgi:hypothetical protein